MAYWFWIFVIYSALGCLIERLFALVSHAPDRTRRCLYILPLCPVYGLGMAAVLALPSALRQGIWLPVSAAIAATGVEFLWHWFWERVCGVRFWDYTGLPGSIQGRVCLPFSLAWGGLCAGAVLLVQPWVEGLIAAIPASATFAALLLVTADAVCSVRILAVTGSLQALREQY